MQALFAILALPVLAAYAVGIFLYGCALSVGMAVRGAVKLCAKKRHT